jgi:hypothetical protein
MPGAMDFGTVDHRQRDGREQAPRRQARVTGLYWWALCLPAQVLGKFRASSNFDIGNKFI